MHRIQIYVYLFFFSSTKLWITRSTDRSTCQVLLFIVTSINLLDLSKNNLFLLDTHVYLLALNPVRTKYEHFQDICCKGLFCPGCFFFIFIFICAPALALKRGGVKKITLYIYLHTSISTPIIAPVSCTLR